MKNQNAAGHLTALFTVIIWGTTFTATKLLLGHFTAIEILFMRFALGYLALAAASVPERLARKERPRRTLRQELYFAAAGLTGVTIYFLMENNALNYSLASNVGIIVAISPLFAALFSSFFLKEEKVSARFFIGFAVSMSGIVLVTLNGNFVLRLNPAGDVLAASAAIVWAIYSVIQKKIQAFGYTVIALTRKTFFYGIIFMIPVMCVKGFHPDPTVLINPRVIFPVLYLGLGASAVCYATWNYSLHILGALKVSAYIYLIPFVGILFAGLVLKEKITPAALAGVVLIMFGLYLSERSFRKAKPDQDAVPVPAAAETVMADEGTDRE